MAWDLPVNGTVTSFSKLVTYVQDTTGGVFGVMMVISIWFIAFVVLKEQHDTNAAVLTASFISLISSLGFWASGFISSSVMVFIGIAFAFVMLGIYLLK